MNAARSDPTLPEELLLIAYDVTGRAKPGGSIELDCGVAGAEKGRSTRPRFVTIG